MRALVCIFALIGISFGGASADAKDQAPGDALDFTFTSIDGDPLPLSQFGDKAVLVVNTASQCGFTPQYEGLQALWNEYREKGLVVLGVPSDDFGGQELGSEAAVKEFCTVNFSIDFPMAEITRVAGDEAHPFYRFAKETLGDKARPRWNFHKYLIGRDGRLVDWFSTTTGPRSPRVIKAIEAVLANPQTG